MTDAVRDDLCDFFGNLSLAMEKLDSTFPTGKLTKMEFEGYLERTLKWNRKECSKAFFGTAFGLWFRMVAHDVVLHGSRHKGFAE